MQNNIMVKSLELHKQGVSLIEIIVTIVWISICIIPMIYTYSELISLQSKLFHRYQALTLTQKNIEIVTNISQSNWQNIISQPKETALMVQQNPLTNWWEITNGTFSESIYKSYFVFKTVCRDSNFTIIDCSDPNVVAQDSNNIQIVSTTNWKIKDVNQHIELTTNLNKVI